MFAMMHLRNFHQISVKEVQQEMTGSAVKSSALDRNSEGRRLKIETIGSYAPPVKKFWLRHWGYAEVIFIQLGGKLDTM